MPRRSTKSRPARSGASQRQLRAGELVRHALVDILRHESLADQALNSVSVTEAVVAGLNRAAKFLRGHLGRVIEMRFTPSLKFVHDSSFGAAAHMAHLLDDPRVRRDILAADGREDG